MEIPYDVLIITAALIALCAVAWFELRYIKNRRGERAEASMEQDHAYNALATIKAVAGSLRSQGRDTTEADILLFQAEGAYKRRQYLDCKELSDRAKTVLRNAPQRELEPPRPAMVDVGKEATGKEQESEASAPAEVPSMEVRKLPHNYLESKFVMESVRCLLENAPSPRRESAQCCLNDAEGCFEEAEYTDALRHSLKAKKMLEAAEDAVPLKEESASPSKEDVSLPVSECPGCGAAMSRGDAFCFSCGMAKRPSCPGCSADIIEGDAFCRKCGNRL